MPPHTTRLQHRMYLIICRIGSNTNNNNQIFIRFTHFLHSYSYFLPSFSLSFLLLSFSFRGGSRVCVYLRDPNAEEKPVP